MRRKLLLLSLILTLIALPLVAACTPAPTPAPAPAPAPATTPAPAPTPKPAAKPVELTLVSFLPSRNLQFGAIQMFMDKVNERSKGELTIKHVGASEVIAQFDQGMAVKDGAVDMAWVPTTMYRGLVPDFPGSYGSMYANGVDDREVGVYDLLQEIHNKGGLFYLGAPVGSYEPVHYSIFTNTKVETPYDLVGQSLGPGTIAPAFLKALGTTVVRMKSSELYTGTERGLIDGFAYTVLSVPGWSLQEVVKYVIGHPFGRSHVPVIFTLDTWNQLPENLQKLMMEAMIDSEKEFRDVYQGLWDEAWQKIMDAGVEVIKFSPADAEWFAKTKYNAQWEEAFEKYPAYSPKLKEMWTR